MISKINKIQDSNIMSCIENEVNYIDFSNIEDVIKYTNKFIFYNIDIIKEEIWLYDREGLCLPIDIYNHIIVNNHIKPTLKEKIKRGLNKKFECYHSVFFDYRLTIDKEKVNFLSLTEMVFFFMRWLSQYYYIDFDNMEYVSRIDEKDTIYYKDIVKYFYENAFYEPKCSFCCEGIGFGGDLEMDDLYLKTNKK